MPKFMQYAMVAAKEALDDAGWHPEDPNDLEMTVSISSLWPLRPVISYFESLKGVCLGSGIGAFEDVYNTSLAFAEHVHPPFPFRPPSTPLTLLTGCKKSLPPIRPPSSHQPSRRAHLHEMGFHGTPFPLVPMCKFRAYQPQGAQPRRIHSLYNRCPLHRRRSTVHCPRRCGRDGCRRRGILHSPTSHYRL